MKKKLILWTLGIVLTTGAAAGYAYFSKKQVTSEGYRTAKAVRGSLSTQIAANGTVNPVITVMVGSQVSGTIQSLYADYNTPVKKGQLIAQIDPATFRAQLSQVTAKVQNARAVILNAEADIGTARSNLDVSKANVTKAMVALKDTRRSLDRNTALFNQHLIAASESDAAQTAHDSALAQLEATRAQQKASEAQLASAKARLTSAHAALKQVEAELELAQVNLNHTQITAPVTGIVISRNVDVGQTVAASLQAPTLFTIAQDLTEMQVEANVSEADIGQVAEGQETTFTVDAFPQNIFTGKVTDIRNSPITVQNVVSYIVIIRLKNPDLKLRPGMTANASILVARRDNVLKIPNAALRFRPESAKREDGSVQKRTAAPSTSALRPSTLQNREQLGQELNLSPEQQAAVSQLFNQARRDMETAGGEPEKIKEIRQKTRSGIRMLLDDTQKQKFDKLPRHAEARQTTTPGHKIWGLASNNAPIPLIISTGISDGLFTEVISGDLKEDQDVIVAAAGGPAKNKTNSSRPGMPGLGGRR